MNLDDWMPVRRNTSRYLLDVEAFVGEFVPWSLRSQPVSPELERALQEAAEQIAHGRVQSVAKTNATSWREAARKSQGGKARRIYAALRDEIHTAVGERMRQIIARFRVRPTRNGAQALVPRAWLCGPAGILTAAQSERWQ